MRRTAKIVPVADTDISWSLPPIPRIEDTDPLALSGDEMLPHIVDLHEELRAVRLLASVALEKIAELEKARAAMVRANAERWEKKRTGQQVR